MSTITIRERQQQEAIARLRILEEQGLMPEVRRDFEQGKLSYSEYLALGNGNEVGVLYWLDQNSELEKAVREVEERTGALAYHATHEAFSFGEVLDVFCVSKHEEEWAADREDLSDGYSLVFAKNLTVDWMSELGTIGFAVKGGGLIRSI